MPYPTDTRDGSGRHGSGQPPSVPTVYLTNIFPTSASSGQPKFAGLGILDTERADTTSCDGEKGNPFGKASIHDTWNPNL